MSSFPRTDLGEALFEAAGAFARADEAERKKEVELSGLRVENSANIALDRAWDEHARTGDKTSATFVDDFVGAADGSSRGKADEVVGNALNALSPRANELERERLRRTLAGRMSQLRRTALETVRLAQGQAAVDEINLWSNRAGAEIEAGPHILGTRLDEYDKRVARFIGVLDENALRDLRSDARASLITSAIGGFLKGDRYDEARKLVGDLGGELDVKARTTLSHSIDVQERVRRAEVKEADEKAREAARDTLTTRILAPRTGEPGEPPPVAVTDILGSKRLHAADKEHLVELLDKRAKAVGDESQFGPRFVDTLRRVHAGEVKSEGELQTLVGNGVTFSGFSQLRQELIGKRTVEGQVEAELKSQFLKSARAAISGTDPLLGLRDAKGEELLTGFHSWFLPEYARQRAAGRSPVELLNPESPSYLGAGIGRFKRSRAEFMKDLMTDNPRIGGAPVEYNSAAEVQEAYRTGKLSREEASRILREKGWAQ